MACMCCCPASLRRAIADDGPRHLLSPLVYWARAPGPVGYIRKTGVCSCKSERSADPSVASGLLQHLDGSCLRCSLSSRVRTRCPRPSAACSMRTRPWATLGSTGDPDLRKWSQVRSIDCKRKLLFLRRNNGAGCPNRTDDLPLTRRVLYQLS